MRRPAGGIVQRLYGARRRAFPRGALVLVLASAGCDTFAPPEVVAPPLSPALVSEPLALVSVQEEVAYVSAVPDAFPSGRVATIRNLTNGRQEEVKMVNGGWDPVRIAAEPGDTLRVRITTREGGIIEYANYVPPIRRPIIVRSNPPYRKRDVPLNATLLVVFSEPIDPATVTPQRVQLLRGGQTVDAGIEVSADGLRMTIRPGAELAPGTEYALVVSPELSDLTGGQLEAGAEVEFSTAPVATVEATGLAFVRGTSVMVSALDGGEPVALVTEASRPAWSPDGTRIAFTRPADNSLTRWQLCIAQADGTNIRCATGAADGVVAGGPSWSPDGAKVAFSAFYFNCPEGQCNPYFSGVSLLNTLTMEVDTLPTPPVTSISWSPDGRKLAISIYGSGTWGRGALGTVNADGSGLVILAESFDSYSVSAVAWSPDGNRLALTLMDEFACPWYCDTAIGVINADGTQLRVLDRVYTSDQVYISTPAWSPSGADLAYTITRGDACYLHDVNCHDIAVVRVDSGRIGHLISNAAFPAWRRTP